MSQKGSTLKGLKRNYYNFLKTFTFNPATVETFLILGTPGSTWGYSHSTPSGLLNNIFYGYFIGL